MHFTFFCFQTCHIPEISLWLSVTENEYDTISQYTYMMRKTGVTFIANTCIFQKKKIPENVCYLYSSFQNISIRKLSTNKYNIHFKNIM